MCMLPGGVLYNVCIARAAVNENVCEELHEQVQLARATLSTSVKNFEWLEFHLKESELTTTVYFFVSNKVLYFYRPCIFPLASPPTLFLPFQKRNRTSHKKVF